MNQSKKIKIVLLSLCIVGVALLTAIGFVVWDWVENSKWTYERVDTSSANDLQEASSEYFETWLRDPKLVAENFFVSEGYGESVETKLIKGGAKKVYLMKNETGQAMKAEVLQPELKGEFGIWMVRRHIDETLPWPAEEWIVVKDQTASEQGSDPKQLAEDFFRSKGYGDPDKTKALLDGKKKLYRILNKDGQALKVELVQLGAATGSETAQPSTSTGTESNTTGTEAQGGNGIWQVSRYIIQQADTTQSQDS